MLHLGIDSTITPGCVLSATDPYTHSSLLVTATATQRQSCEASFPARSLWARRTMSRLPCPSAFGGLMDNFSVPAVAARVRGRAKRVALRAPVVNHWSEQRWLAQLGRHAEKLPWLTQEGFEIVTTLRSEGIVVRDASALLSRDIMAIADRFIDQLREVTVHKSRLSVLPDDLVTDPALYKWGLNDDNLNVAENYIGLPVHYRGVAVKRERADGIAADTRQWHLDPEDRRLLKIIVYLNDVDDGCGLRVHESGRDQACRPSPALLVRVRLRRSDGEGGSVKRLGSGDRPPPDGSFCRHQFCFPSRQATDFVGSILDDIQLRKHDAAPGLPGGLLESAGPRQRE